MTFLQILILLCIGFGTGIGTLGLGLSVFYWLACRRIKPKGQA